MTPNHQSPARSIVHRGFTLIELLVVIGIIALLVGIAVPALNTAYKNGIRTRMNADLIAIASGLDAYRGDFADYPRLDYMNLTGLSQQYGASLLTWALLAPGDVSQDGAAGPGFTVRTQGQGSTYGPYIAPDRFKIKGTSTQDGSARIADRYLHAYLYFPAYKGANIQQKSGYVADWTGSGTRPMFNHADGVPNPAEVPPDPTLSLADMQNILGDANNDGGIGTGESAAFTGPYLLWGAGPDEAMGYDPNFTGTPKRSDDVTNYNR